MFRKVVEPMTVLCAGQELTIPEISKYAEKYTTEIMSEADKYGLRVTGPWIFVSHNLPKNGNDRYKIEFCLPISNEDVYSGARFLIKTLSSFPCSCTEYNGALRYIFTKGYQPLVREIVAEKLRFTGESREVYHSWVDPNSPENRIEIQFGVA